MSENEITTLPLPIEVPIMDQTVFSLKVGVSADTVRGMVNNKVLPSIKYGKRRFINVAKLTQECLNEALRTKLK